ncbi:MAG: tRNA (N6-threonylcarbamoyladenosine(37)-N6)-methyltransferase TrmO [Candidatus Methanodesulfokora sp.]|jgi:tRNA-Thr(GGU) m(6)t(6)A37 methyltransferase TsaA
MYILKPIGVVHSAPEDVIKSSFEGVKGVVEVFEEYAEGLHGIDGFSHIILVAYLDRVSEEQRRVLKVRFRRLRIFGIESPEVGVFCSDSPHRPNPIALSIVKLIRREGRFLHVDGLDLFDGTPIVDIRAYTPDRAICDAEFPEWYIS